MPTSSPSRPSEPGFTATPRLGGPERDRYGDDTLEFRASRMLYEQYIMRGEAFLLDTRARTVVDDTIRAVCVRRHWELHALNVRTNHVHAAVSAHFAPEPVMTAFKAWATRELVAAGGAAQGRKVWTRHGSTRYLWNEEDLWAAVNYIENGQGEDLPRSWPKRQPADDRSLPVAAQSETPGDHDV